MLGSSSKLFFLRKYCWWLKSCTTWDVWNPINNGKNYLSTGAGFQPGTFGTSKCPAILAIGFPPTQVSVSGPSALPKSMQEKVIVAALPYALESCLQIDAEEDHSQSVMTMWEPHTSIRMERLVVLDWCREYTRIWVAWSSIMKSQKDPSMIYSYKICCSIQNDINDTCEGVSYSRTTMGIPL